MRFIAFSYSCLGSLRAVFDMKLYLLRAFMRFTGSIDRRVPCAPSLEGTGSPVAALLLKSLVGHETDPLSLTPPETAFVN